MKPFLRKALKMAPGPSKDTEGDSFAGSELGSPSEPESVSVAKNKEKEDGPLQKTE